jgi:hypothetical protein
MRAFKCSSFFIFILKFDLRKIIKNVLQPHCSDSLQGQRLELLTSKKTGKKFQKRTKKLVVKPWIIRCVSTILHSIK